MADNKQLVQELKISHLAVVLCRDSFFGDDVLIKSTVTGRRGNPLRLEKLSNLKSIIRDVADPNRLQSDEQFECVWKGEKVLLLITAKDYVANRYLKTCVIAYSLSFSVSVSPIRV